jgi:hypothetical protein
MMGAVGLAVVVRLPYLFSVEVMAHELIELDIPKFSNKQPFTLSTRRTVK